MLRVLKLFNATP